MKRIAVIPNNSKDIGLVNTKRLVEFLNGKAEIYIDEAYSVLGLNVNYVAESEILDNAEYLIVLGGDGTILQRAAECAKRKLKNIFSVPRIPSGEGYFRHIAGPVKSRTPRNRRTISAVYPNTSTA